MPKRSMRCSAPAPSDHWTIETGPRIIPNHARADASMSQRSIPLGARSSTGRRFALARLVGDHLDTANPNDDQIEDAASAFDVSPLLTKTTLVNQRIIARQALISE